MTGRPASRLLVLLFIFLFLAGCENFSLYNEIGLENLKAGGFFLLPASATVLVDSSITFTASGGTPPYEYFVTSGSGTIDIDTGLFTAPSLPGTNGVKVVDAEDLVRSVSVTVVTPEALRILPVMITLSSNDVFFFTALGGTTPYVFSVTSGGGSIDMTTGEFHSPGVADTTNVRVTDNGGAGSSANATVTTRDGLVIIPQTVAVPANNNVAFSASGGVPPYTYIMESPAGSGTVTAGGFYTASGLSGAGQVRVTDSTGSFRIATINITPAQPLNISPSSFIMLTGSNFNFSAHGGTPPYTYAKIAGLGSITPEGAFSSLGVPGIGYVRVTDSLALTADAEIRIVSIGPLTIYPGTVTVEQGKSYTFTASGGTPQYSYSVVAPGSGIIITTSGEYTAPAAIGTETVRVTDAALSQSDATVNIAPAAPSNLIATSPANGQIMLDWNDNSTGEDGFVIQRRTSGQAFADLVTVPPVLPAGTTSYTDTGLNPVVAFSYRVRAYSGALSSGYSNEDFTVPKP